jgi:hypothetical protein
MPKQAKLRSRRLLSAAVLTSVTLTACGPTPDPFKADPVQAIADNRFLKVIHSPDPIEEEEPPPEDQINTDEVREHGQRHRGEEGKMGRPTSRSKSGLYAMKGPKDAIARAAPATPAICTYCESAGADRYRRPDDNPWTRVLAEPLSTFSIDVDTASYSNVRRFLRGRSLPPTAAVRTEELINYFDYDYAPPSDGRPVTMHAEVAPCPWNPTHKLVHVGLQGKHVTASELGPRNLVFLIDVSGSMDSEDKLPLLRAGLRKLVADMKARDHISIVAYAGASGLVLPPTSGANKETILAPSTTSPPAARPTAAPASPSPTPRPASTSSRAASTASFSPPTATSTSASPITTSSSASSSSSARAASTSASSASAAATSATT